MYNRKRIGFQESPAGLMRARSSGFDLSKCHFSIGEKKTLSGSSGCSFFFVEGEKKNSLEFSLILGIIIFIMARPLWQII